MRNTLAQPADLIFLLLGDDYLAGCEIDGGVTLGGPCLLFCGGHAAKRLPELPRLHKIELGNSHAKRFSCGLVGLKGELTSRFLAVIYTMSPDPNHGGQNMEQRTEVAGLWVRPFKLA